MSKISDIYEAAILRLEDLFPEHNRLPNPYKPEENNELFLKQGYGLALLGASSPRPILSCKLSVARDINIVLTRKYFARENDFEGKSSAELQLLEDQFLLIQDFHKDTTLNETATMMKYVSDAGIQYVSTEKDQFLLLETTFAVEYFEDL